MAIRFPILAKLVAIFLGGRTKHAKAQELAEGEPEAAGVDNEPATAPVPAAAPSGATDKGKGKESAPGSVPTSTPASTPSSPGKARNHRRVVTDPGAASSSRIHVTPSPTRPSSPPTQTHPLVSTSGAQPQTHPALHPPPTPAPIASTSATTTTISDGVEPVPAPPSEGTEVTTSSKATELEKRARLEQRDEFVCDGAGGVNAGRLLGIVRRELLTQAGAVGANALVDEHWSVTIYPPRRAVLSKGSRTRVQIVYSAIAARCPFAADPLVPVALSEAKSVPGLMTVLERL